MPQGAEGSFCAICENGTSSYVAQLNEKENGGPSRHQILQNLMITTETAIDLPIEKRLGIVTAECVAGMNLFKDIASSFRDVFGGRAQSTQTGLRDAKNTVLRELKSEAAELGANAVIAVSLAYSEMTGGGNSMLMVTASGTAVRIADPQKT